MEKTITETNTELSAVTYDDTHLKRKDIGAYTLTQIFCFFDMEKPQKYFFFFDDKTSVSSAAACEVCNRVKRIAVRKEK